VCQQKRNVFDSNVKSLQYFHTDNVLERLILNAVFKNVLCYEIEVGNV